MDTSAALCLQRAGDLIRAARGLHAAANAAQPFDHVVDLHPGEQLGDSLQIAGAAPDDFDGTDDAVLNIKVELAGADAVRHIAEFHVDVSFPTFVVYA